LATQAGFDVLASGGNAVDAAVATQMVLSLVEPQSSGLGGGAFLLHFDGDGVQAFDGRETAPAKATESLFLDESGKPMAFFDAVVGGRSVGVPGVLSMLEQVHTAHGKLPWSTLMAPAITLADKGFPVSERLHQLLSADKYLRQDPQAAAYFYNAQGKAWPVGHLLKNPELAQVLRLVAAQCAKGLMQGEVAQAVVDKVQQHPTNPGLLSLSDLSQYRPKVREAFCSDYKRYTLCGMPPPSSGAITVAQIIGQLQHVSATTPLATNTTTTQPSADWLHNYLESSRLAFADRARYIADPDFVQAPANDWHSLVAPSYLASRAALIGQTSMGKASHGNPGEQAMSYGVMASQPEYGTSHISIVDGNGHAVAMTTTIENGFGSRQMVKGFLLNNQLTDFSFAPADAAGQPIANRVEAGKRPRSSMAPTLVFDKDSNALMLSVGSPGGSLIIHYTAKTLLGMLDWGLSAQQAMDMPNFANNNGASLLEAQRFAPATVQALEARGHTVRQIDMTSGLQAVGRVNGQGIQAGADPRREGVVMGR
jgi:gamma-glutamyltranspeptidase/glutathione hydrolase